MVSNKNKNIAGRNRAGAEATQPKGETPSGTPAGPKKLKVVRRVDRLPRTKNYPVFTGLLVGSVRLAWISLAFIQSVFFLAYE